MKMERNDLGLRDYFYILRRDVSVYPYRNKVNTTQLNLAAFRVACDYSIHPHRRLPLERSRNTFERSLKKAKLVLEGIEKDDWLFISTPIIERMDSKSKSMLSRFEGTVVIDPLDRELSQRPSWLSDCATWCAPHIPNPLSTSGICIPVGVEEMSHNRNGRPSLLQYHQRKNNKVLVGPFGFTHIERRDYLDLSKTENVDVLTVRMKPKDYSSLASNYQFVFCPRGNGIDTHRFWETLYRGSIPVVFNSEWATYFMQLGVPMVTIECIDEIYALPQKAPIFSHEDILSAHKTVLTLEFWIRRIQQFNDSKNSNL